MAAGTEAGEAVIGEAFLAVVEPCRSIAGQR
jgi:hypothetical protein